ncbi:MAG: efflux RND transporter periplasmic adaptor subunit [Deltaproteobacteria bacterium]|nr:efflux RND transporter periplasmic adaptor subunit [Deltaproteobacteria bacterium]
MTEPEGRETHGPGEPLPEGKEPPPPGTRAMAVVRWSLVAGMALLAVLALRTTCRESATPPATKATRYHCPMHPTIVRDRPGECPICGMGLVPVPEKPDARAGQKTVLATGPVYACPMHPDQTSSDSKAECPICGMRLEPRPTAGPDHGGHGVPGLAPLQLSPDRVQLIGMRTAKVTRERLVPNLRTVGFVSATETGVAHVHTRFSGWIEHLYVSQTGARVKKGDPLATIYSPQLLTAQQEYLNALKWSSGATRDGGSSRLGENFLEDARRRLELLGISAKEIDELKRTGERIRAVKLRAPISGYVARKTALHGLFVQPGTELFELADLSTLWVLAEIYEYEIPRVTVGQTARLALRGQAEDFTGRVTFIHPTLNPETRTLRVRLEFKNPKLRLRPGMYGDVNIDLEPAEGLVLPLEAVVDTGAVQYVFVALSEGRFEPRRVRLGARSGGKVQALSGVGEGEIVVTTANFLIDSESRLRAAIEGLSGGRDGAAPRAPSDAGLHRHP